MRVLGISAFYHDSAAALIRDGEIVAAVQEERFTRKKHDAGFPTEAIEYCLKTDGCRLQDIDAFVFYEKPFLKFERLLETYLAFAPAGFSSFRKALPIWLHEKLFQKQLMTKQIRALAGDKSYRPKLYFSEHHLSHAASAFYPSPFERALVLTMDGVGEWTTTSVAIGNGNELKLLREIQFPHSIGLLYSAFTYYLGFKVNSGEYKVMGLAPYGEPKYKKIFFDHIIDVKSDGSFRLNLEYFQYCTGLRMTNEKLDALFDLPRRTPEKQLTQKHMDIAASLQAALEDIVLGLVRAVVSETGEKNLCMAGGVALNCVANGKILREKLVDSLWVQPAAGDAGGALGAAYSAYFGHFKKTRNVNKRDSMKGAYLGPSPKDFDVETELTKAGAKFRRLDPKDVAEVCAKALSDGKALGWCQGRMEFGPRALGSRSIIADPRVKDMQTVLNLKVKFRESFRPFAPIVMREHLSEWFDLSCDSPYMLLVAPVLEKHRIQTNQADETLFGIEKLKFVRSSVPAVTHVDFSARIQTVHSETNPLLYDLMKSFRDKTGCPVLVNTSFNVRGEPIVCTPSDAFRCFMGTDLDVLAVDNFILYKEDQDPALKLNYKDAFELD